MHFIELLSDKVTQRNVKRCPCYFIKYPRKYNLFVFSFAFGLFRNKT